MELFKTALSTVSSVLSAKDSARASGLGNDSNSFDESSNLLLSSQHGAGTNARSSSFKSELNVVAGVIKEGETNQMTKLIYRASRGKVATFFENIGTVRSEYDESNSGKLGSV